MLSRPFSADRPFVARRLLAALAFALMCVLGSGAWAQQGGPAWSQLTSAQREALKPLERDWSRIDAEQKQKWVEVAQRMRRMKPAQRERLQARMDEWARMSPQQRGQARLGFEQSRQVGKKNRRAEWEAYQALSAEQRRQLQSRAAPAGRPTGPHRGEKSQAKSNIVPNPAYAPPPRPISPTVVQAQPGATTSLMSRQPSPPVHEQTGLPKIVATPEFVDRHTLLPRRGPQAAGIGAPAASAADRRR